MTEEEKLYELRILLGGTDDDEATLLTYLDMAKAAILDRLYPYTASDEEYETLTVPARYEKTQLKIATYLLNKRGAEGEATHVENGISRSYRHNDIPGDMLMGIIPSIGIPR